MSSLFARALAILALALALGLALLTPAVVNAAPGPTAVLVGADDDDGDDGDDDDTDDDTDDGAAPVGGVDTGGGALSGSATR